MIVVIRDADGDGGLYLQVVTQVVIKEGVIIGKMVKTKGKGGVKR